MAHVCSSIRILGSAKRSGARSFPLRGGESWRSAVLLSIDPGRRIGLRAEKKPFIYFHNVGRKNKLLHLFTQNFPMWVPFFFFFFYKIAFSRGKIRKDYCVEAPPHQSFFWFLIVVALQHRMLEQTVSKWDVVENISTKLPRKQSFFSVSFPNLQSFSNCIRSHMDVICSHI